MAYLPTFKFRFSEHFYQHIFIKNHLFLINTIILIKSLHPQIFGFSAPSDRSDGLVVSTDFIRFRLTMAYGIGRNIALWF